MARAKIISIRFIPPVAVARLGNSDTPLEAFSWVEDPRLFGAGKTIIHPEPSLEVLPDGSAEPYLPNLIRFKDGQGIRPVCPFFELHAEVEDEGLQPLTPELIERAGLDLSQLKFRVIAANLKAKRQNGDPAGAFEARLQTNGADYRKQDLWAWTHGDAPNPLVTPDRPIWLGAFQVIRPVRRKPKYEVSTSTIRVRFTPGRGAVYGPPSAVTGQTVGSRRKHEVVPAANRILNPKASWCSFNANQSNYPNPIPGDCYDGQGDMDLGDDGFGVVDDTCDAVITASFANFFEDGQPKWPTAFARVLVGPPHYSPDRRHLYSFAEDLADRDAKSARESLEKLTPREWLDAVTDLFQRIWETGSQINIERQRDLDLTFNYNQKNVKSFPEIGEHSMTERDYVDGQRLMSDRFLALANRDAGDGANDAPLLPKSEQARIRHGELRSPEVLLEFMIQNRERFERILRRPFRRMSDPEVDIEHPKPDQFRDARIKRSYLYDARMPPFLRDCDFGPLSLTRRQWDLLFAKNNGEFLMKQVYETLIKK